MINDAAQTVVKPGQKIGALIPAKIQKKKTAAILQNVIKNGPFQLPLA
jgi:hypothetical protein